MKNSKIILITIVVLIAIVSGTTYAQDTDTYTVGILSVMYTPNPEEIENTFVIEAMAGLEELGYVEGENITYLYERTFSIMEPEAIQAAAQALVDAKPDVIITTFAYETHIIQELTDDIPVVFGPIADPVAEGFVDSLLNPGGNLTGLHENNPDERRLQIMKEIDPTLSKVYFPYDPQGTAGLVLPGMMETAEKLDVELVPVEFTDPDAIQEALENIPEDIDGIFLLGDPKVLPNTTVLVNTAVSLEAVVSFPSPVVINGVEIGYGVDMVGAGNQVAGIVDRILRGADPADMAVEPAQHSLLINLISAEMINLDIPRGMLRQADIIIRPGDLDEEGQGE